MSVLKIVAALLVIAGGALVGAAVGGAFDFTEVTDKAEPIKVVKREPTTFSFLAEEITSGDTSTYNNQSVGHKYKNYLVGTYGKDGHLNQKWWEESYERYRKTDSKDSLAEEFGKDKIDKGFDEKSNVANSKALNQVCDTLYKKTLDESVKKSGSEAKYKKALWTYCSDLQGIPQTVNDHDSNTIDNLYKNGNDEFIGKTKKDDLLSTKASINKKLWQWKHKEFFALDSVTEHYFKKLKDDNSKKRNLDSLKETCEEAYKKKAEQDAEGKVKDATVVKYCSLNGAAA